jgi:antitoxin CcdA
MRMTTRSTAQKKAVNLSIDADVLQAARQYGLNLSATLEQALAEETARRWLAENRDSIEAYNEEVRAHGVWSEGWRRW